MYTVYINLYIYIYIYINILIYIYIYTYIYIYIFPLILSHVHLVAMNWLYLEGSSGSQHGGKVDGTLSSQQETHGLMN